MLTAICTVLILLSMLSLSIISELKVEFDIFGNTNAIVFILFGIKVIEIDFVLMRDSTDVYRLELWNGEKMIKSLGLTDLNKDNARATASSAIPNPLYNIDIVELEVNLEYGGDNALNTVVLAFAARGLIECAHMYIASTQRVRVVSYVKPNFDTKTFRLNLSGIFCITFADIIYGIIFGKRRKEK